MITQELVKEYLTYKNGELHWIKPKARAKGRFGTFDGRYRVGSFFGKRLKEHQLIWFYHYGTWPKMIDHKDRNKSNNKIDNLIETDTFKNSQNTDRTSFSSKQVGVSFYKRTGKWRARTWYDGKRIELGMFETEQLAIESYLSFNKSRL